MSRHIEFYIVYNSGEKNFRKKKSEPTDSGQIMKSSRSRFLRTNVPRMLQTKIAIIFCTFIRITQNLEVQHKYTEWFFLFEAVSAVLKNPFRNVTVYYAHIHDRVPRWSDIQTPIQDGQTQAVSQTLQQVDRWRPFVQVNARSSTTQAMKEYRISGDTVPPSQPQQRMDMRDEPQPPAALCFEIEVPELLEYDEGVGPRKK